MYNRIISIATGLVLVFGIGYFVYETKQPTILSPENFNNSQEFEDDDFDDIALPLNTISPTPQSTLSSGIKLAQVTLHNSRSSCWSAINGGVYDLTSWIPNHPGGESTILSICGKDGSSAYGNQHGNSLKTAKMLVGFKIGTLAQ